MIAALKSELRKLLTVRSTYILVAIALGLTVLFNYLSTSSTTYEEAVCETTGEVLYSNNYNGPVQSSPDGAMAEEEMCAGEVIVSTKVDKELSENKLIANIQEGASIASLFIAITVVLMMAHEFRYNTISYSLTSSNSRTKFFLSKLTIAISFILVVSLLAAGITVATTYAAVNMKDLVMPAQDYNWLYLLARIIGNTLGFSLIGFALVTMVRSLTAGIAALFVLPTLDQLGGFLLASRDIIEPTKVLPYSALERMGNALNGMNGMPVGGISDGLEPASVAHASLVVFVYVVGLLLIAWALFLRRDAN